MTRLPRTKSPELQLIVKSLFAVTTLFLLLHVTESPMTAFRLNKLDPAVIVTSMKLNTEVRTTVRICATKSNHNIKLVTFLIEDEIRVHYDIGRKFVVMSFWANECQISWQIGRRCLLECCSFKPKNLKLSSGVFAENRAQTPFWFCYWQLLERGSRKFVTLLVSSGKPNTFYSIGVSQNKR